MHTRVVCGVLQRGGTEEAGDRHRLLLFLQRVEITNVARILNTNTSRVRTPFAVIRYNSDGRPDRLRSATAAELRALNLTQILALRKHSRRLILVEKSMIRRETIALIHEALRRHAVVLYRPADSEQYPRPRRVRRPRKRPARPPVEEDDVEADLDVFNEASRVPPERSNDPVPVTSPDVLHVLPSQSAARLDVESTYLTTRMLGHVLRILRDDGVVKFAQKIEEPEPRRPPLGRGGSGRLLSGESRLLRAAVVEMISANPQLMASQIARSLGVSIATVAGHLRATKLTARKPSKKIKR